MKGYKSLYNALGVALAVASSLPAASTTASPRHNLSLLLMLPYGIKNDLELPFSEQNTHASILSLDIAADLAIEEPSRYLPVFPSETVNIQLSRLDNWSPSFSSLRNLSLTTSGGYAAVALYEALSTQPVAAVVGDYYSRTTLFTAALASQFKVPMCGSTQGTPRLSDKREFEYFFRLLPTNFAYHLAKLFRHIQVDRVALVYGADALGVGVAKTFDKVFARAEIRIAAAIKLSREQLQQLNFGYAFDRLRRSGVTYFVSLLGMLETHNFYFAAVNESLVGPDYVWFGINPLIVFDKSAPDYAYKRRQAQGYITVGYNDKYTYPVRKFSRVFQLALTKRNPTYAENFTMAGGNSVLMFDCVRTLLSGMKQLLDSSPNLTVSDLSRPEVRAKLTVAKFARTGYSGAFASEIILSENGELKLPVSFYTIPATDFNASGYNPDTNGWLIAESDSDSDDIMFSDEPVLWAGITNFPSNGNPYHERAIRQKSALAYVMQGLPLIAALVLALTFLRWTSFVIRAHSPKAVQFTAHTQAAGLLFALSMFFSGTQSASGRDCLKFRVCEHVAYALLFSTLAYWKRHHYVVKHNPFHQTHAGSLAFGYSVVVALAGLLNLLLVSGLYQQRGGQLLLRVNMDASREFMITCIDISSGQGGFVAVTVVEAVLLATAMYHSSRSPGEETLNQLVKIAMFAFASSIALGSIIPATIAKLVFTHAIHLVLVAVSSASSLALMTHEDPKHERRVWRRYNDTRTTLERIGPSLADRDTEVVCLLVGKVSYMRKDHSLTGWTPFASADVIIVEKSLSKLLILADARASTPPLTFPITDLPDDCVRLLAPASSEAPSTPSGTASDTEVSSPPPSRGRTRRRRGIGAASQFAAQLDFPFRFSVVTRSRSRSREHGGGGGESGGSATSAGTATTRTPTTGSGLGIGVLTRAGSVRRPGGGGGAGGESGLGASAEPLQRGEGSVRREAMHVLVVVPGRGAGGGGGGGGIENRVQAVLVFRCRDVAQRKKLEHALRHTLQR
ncbi:hypothetical protein HDU96_002740 [Phlyctochytrium bullatum]|nr:hypothetical protein HDU96_002740 [Phlyctochytrium bullatum]